MFFFSSRRRHTRSLCDWSSDVCSSDLGHTPRSSVAASSGAVRSSPSASATRSCLRRSEEHTSELQSHSDLVCRLLLEKKKKKQTQLSKARTHVQDTYNSTTDGTTKGR